MKVINGVYQSDIINIVYCRGHILQYGIHKPQRIYYMYRNIFSCIYKYLCDNENIDIK